VLTTHTFLLFHNFVTSIQEESRKKLIGPNEVIELMDLALLFGLYWIEKEVGVSLRVDI